MSERYSLPVVIPMLDEDGGTWELSIVNDFASGFLRFNFPKEKGYFMLPSSIAEDVLKHFKRK